MENTKINEMTAEIIGIERSTAMIFLTFYYFRCIASCNILFKYSNIKVSG